MPYMDPMGFFFPANAFRATLRREMGEPSVFLGDAWHVGAVRLRQNAYGLLTRGLRRVLLAHLMVQSGPKKPVINGVSFRGPYKWPERNGFAWGYFTPIKEVMGPYL